MTNLKYHISEVFLSLEGEGPMVGRPMVFLRFFGCNLTCPGFGRLPTSDRVTSDMVDSLKDAEKSTLAISDRLDSLAEQYKLSSPNKKTPILRSYEPAKTLEQVKVLPVGCDSAYAWHPTYKNLRKTYTLDELWSEIKEKLPNGKWSYKTLTKNKDPWAYAGEPVILCFTGGEPLMHQPQINTILNDDRFSLVEEVLFETNGTREWHIDDNSSKKITVCVSPKLSNSGEPFNRRINLVALKSISEAKFIGKIDDYYVKFVTDGSESQIEEIIKVMDLWAPCNPPDIYLMPEGSNKEQTRKVQTHVANQCLKYGFRFSPRLHCELWDNSIGT